MAEIAPGAICFPCAMADCELELLLFLVSPPELILDDDEEEFDELLPLLKFELEAAAAAS